MIPGVTAADRRHARSLPSTTSAARAAMAMVVLVAATLGVSAPVLAQSAGTPKIEIVDIDVTDHPTVTVVITSSGLPRAGLGAGAVVVREDGVVIPADVVAVAGDELQVIVALDTSGSMEGEAWRAARAAAVDFVDQLPAGVAIATIAFGNVATVTSEFSTDKSRAIDAVEAMRVGGSTALYDAASLAAGLAVSAAATPYLVILSDGADTASSASLSEATLTLNAASVTTYAVSLVNEGSDRGSLASLSANRVVEAEDADALSEVYGALAEQLSNQYTVRYESQANGATGIQIEISHDGRTFRDSQRLTLPVLAPTVSVAEQSGDQSPSRQVFDDGRSSLPATPAAPAAAVSSVAPETSGLDGSWTLLVGALALAAAFLAMFVVLLTTKGRAQKPRSQVVVRRAPTGSRLRDLAASAAASADQVMAGRGSSRGLNTLLERAGSPLRLGEFLVGSGGVVFVLGLLGLALGGLVGGVLLLVLGLVGARVFLVAMGKRRLKAFEGQLGPTLQLMATALRTGHGLLQAVSAVALEAESPTREEFHRVTAENRLGRDLVESLDAMAMRLDNDDFEWIVQAIAIQRDIGGDLAEILDNVASTIADRSRIRRQVDALSADGRISARVLMALPLVAAVMFSFIQPGYLDALFRQTAGQIMVAGATLLMVVGAIWLKKIVELDF
ncbi:MAG: tight adherence protein B [Candidatus Poriferisodalaceae bacterium]|jgi:tight adherence protein B